MEILFFFVLLPKTSQQNRIMLVIIPDLANKIKHSINFDILWQVRRVSLWVLLSNLSRPPTWSSGRPTTQPASAGWTPWNWRWGVQASFSGPWAQPGKKSLINNRIVGGLARLGLDPRCGTDGLGQYKTPDMWYSVWDGLWRPGEAFLQIGLGCVMSRHHIVGLCRFLLKFWREDWKCISCQQNLYPVAQIRLNSHKIVYSWIRAFLVAQICPNLHKINYSWIRAFPVAQISPNLHKIA